MVEIKETTIDVHISTSESKAPTQIQTQRFKFLNPETQVHRLREWLQDSSHAGSADFSLVVALIEINVSLWFISILFSWNDLVVRPTP
jgi:hypothetical protein